MSVDFGDHVACLKRLAYLEAECRRLQAVIDRTVDEVQRLRSNPHTDTAAALLLVDLMLSPHTSPPKG